jgi:putative flippase GtrA
MKKLIKKMLSYKIIKYTIWWWLGAFLDLSFLYCFTEFLWIYYIYSSILSFCFSFTFGYLFQKHITFQNKSKKHLLQWWLFLLFQIVWLAINMLFLRIFAKKLWFHYMIVSFLTKFVVFIWNYLSNYFFNFRK